MGDRANVYMKQSETTGVYLYTHWGGDELPETVREAIASPQGRGRWRDDAYLARIIFCRMVGPRDLMEETGFGISAHICDNEHPIIVVDCKNLRVGYAEPSPTSPPEPAEWIAFRDFCAQTHADYPSEDA